jgi:hypothetical protein
VSSDEEDFESLTVGRTQVIGLGVSGSGYEFAATDPTVLVDKSVPFGVSGRYHMWFEGRSGVSGGTSKIIHCVSGNGIAWSNFQTCLGLDPTFGSVRVADPCVVLDGALFRMWFEAIDGIAAGGADGPATIGYADSTDGVTWILRDAAGQMGAAAGPVFVPGAPQRFDSYSAGSPSVVIDPAEPAGSAMRFKLWYEAGDVAASTENTIGYATSPNGLSWSDPQLPVLVPSSDSLVPLPFDSGDLEHPAAAIDDDVPAATVGHFLLWYTGDGEGGAVPNQIGLARGRNGP